MRTTALLLAAALVAGSGVAPAAAEANDSTGVVVHVENRNFLDVRVYALVAGAPYRLGTVSSFSEEAIQLPKFVVGLGSEIQLVAVPIGSTRANYAPTMFVGPGDEWVYRVENSLGLSTLVKIG